MRLHPRADDGIRTRDPHLGKVMRYQLRYIRVPRTTSSPVAKDDDSPLERSRTNLRRPPSRPALGAVRILGVMPCRANLRRRSTRSIFRSTWLARSRSSVGERPLHTRKVAGSIPAGTTHRLTAPTSQRADGSEFYGFFKVSGSCPVGNSTGLVHSVKVGGDCVQLRVVKVAVDVGRDDRGGVAECALHKPQVSARGAGQGSIGVAEIVNG